MSDYRAWRGPRAGTRLWRVRIDSGDARILPDGVMDLMWSKGRFLFAGADTTAMVSPGEGRGDLGAETGPRHGARAVRRARPGADRSALGPGRAGLGPAPDRGGRPHRPGHGAGRALGRTVAAFRTRSERLEPGGVAGPIRSGGARSPRDRVPARVVRTHPAAAGRPCLRVRTQDVGLHPPLPTRPEPGPLRCAAR